MKSIVDSCLTLSFGPLFMLCLFSSEKCGLCYLCPGTAVNNYGEYCMDAGFFPNDDFVF